MRSLLLALVVSLLSAQAALAQRADMKIFNHLDLGINLGTTGIGLDLAMPVGDIVRLRAGYSFTPRFRTRVNFAVYVGEDYTESVQQSKFARLTELMRQYTGMELDRNIDMQAEPTMQNFSFLVDVFPFRNKHWRVTAGFYWGPARVGYAENAIEDATSLVAVNLYNTMYERILNSFENDVPYISTNTMDLYATEDLYNSAKYYGRMGVREGYFNDTGEPYMLEPDKDNTVKARITVNNFKPYLGFGYEGRLFKNDDKYTVGFDCGVLFWGGTPHVITHDGTDLSHDVHDINTLVGDYVEVIKKFKVYPVISLRITRNLF